MPKNPSPRPLTAEEYVEARLRQLRAGIKKKTVFTQAGKQVIREGSERKLLGPDGRPIKVQTDPEGNTVISTDKIQAVHIKPNTVRTGGGVLRPGGPR